jgi:hypothetical protein
LQKCEEKKQKLRRAAHLVFPQNSKTIVADHQQLKKAICAVAITHARQSDRSLVFLVLVLGNQVQPP